MSEFFETRIENLEKSIPLSAQEKQERFLEKESSNFDDSEVKDSDKDQKGKKM